jgi:thiopeptide-type bacteriocin biosynthesis protein
MAWLSFHLFLQEGLDDFLVSVLPPFLAMESERGSFRRFFFIRYSEGGHHLRLRFLVRHRAELEERLAGCVATASGAGFRLETVPYDRTQHYFGETLASVYAELLNEATSRLALRLLAVYVDQPPLRRWLVLAATLDLLAGDLEESRSFARRAAESLLGPEAIPALEESEQAARRWSAPLGAVRTRLRPALGADRDIRLLAALLRRARRVPDGPFVGVHGLHLLCNKLGFSLIEEYAAFAALIQDRRA